MKIEVDISDDKLQNLSSTAHSEIIKVTIHTVEEILDEASRIEESRRTSNSNPEITAAIINDAVFFNKKYGIRKKRPKKKIFAQIIAFLSSVLTGGLFDTDKFIKTEYTVIFLLVFAISVMSSIYLITNNEHND